MPSYKEIADLMRETEQKLIMEFLTDLYKLDKYPAKLTLSNIEEKWEGRL